MATSCRVGITGVERDVTVIASKPDEAARLSSVSRTMVTVMDRLPVLACHAAPMLIEALPGESLTRR